MAKQVLLDDSFKVNGVDLSDHVRSITVESMAADIDVTCMGATAKQHAQGLRDDKVTVKWAQDFAASSVDATLWPIFTGGTPVGATIKPTSATVGNVVYSGSILLIGYQPLAGQVGALSEINTPFLCQGALTRATI